MRSCRRDIRRRYGQSSKDGGRSRSFMSDKGLLFLGPDDMPVSSVTSNGLEARHTRMRGAKSLLEEV